MWIAISVVALAVLGAAVYAGSGKLGAMPQVAVNDRPKGNVPAGPVTPEFLEVLRVPRAFTGYRPEQVDPYLAGIASGRAAPAGTQSFDVVRRGYDMQVVDDLIERPRPSQLPEMADDSVAEDDQAAFRPPTAEPALVAQPGTNLPDAE
ncbi:hypothetical protein H5392_00265 [Tessaracoccus sp. MC1865]|uniref:hypothetical protein n=1 Tax=Tessaracoccus sp. MC1865 TaxID=2760310 RepID=UPI001602F2EA|nr:hypothetical protein [Tessaracoccus sp. MC1865]MBB1482293.1 hypothetical protein [Tessaracoccus sp. MC1865]QTO38238.1 hypothetical protein J7D54_03810 [Tessaracoccus sp. MC1865]